MMKNSEIIIQEFNENLDNEQSRLSKLKVSYEKIRNLYNKSDLK